jgi:hypothetical protein
MTITVDLESKCVRIGEKITTFDEWCAFCDVINTATDVFWREDKERLWREQEAEEEAAAVEETRAEAPTASNSETPPEGAGVTDRILFYAERAIARGAVPSPKVIAEQARTTEGTVSVTLAKLRKTGALPRPTKP